MRSPRHLLALFLPFLLTAVATAPAVAQEEPPPPPTPPTERTERPAGEQPRTGNRARPRGEATRQDPARRRGPRRAPIAVEAGFVHPVSGPAIANGVVLVRGDRIVAVGKQGEVEIPADATTRSFPTGHVYPGLIDAATDAFTDPATAQANLSHDLAIGDDLQPRHNRDDTLAAAGITTAYVAANGGQGAVVRPTRTGFEVWSGKEKAALQLRLTGGPVPSHPLQRQQQLDGALKVFDDLDKYEKAKEDYNKALDKYAEDFKAWLDYHEKKKAAGKPTAEKAEARPESAPAPEPPSGERSSRRGSGRRGGPPGGGSAEVDEAIALLLAALAEEELAAAPQEPKPTPDKPQPVQDPKPEAQKPEAQKPEAKKDEPPKRPTWPKEVAEDPAKEALLKVLAGELPLRVEAHRLDELRAALRFLREKDVPLLVLEKAYGAAGIADELAQLGALVVLTDLLPSTMPEAYEDFDPPALPAVLDRHGVPFAIASGSARRAPLLPLMAAAAVGHGLPPAAALRAITLTPAEILGIQQDTGSLQAGKFADLVVFDRPLFQSDSRVLFVLGRGRTEFEAQGRAQ